DMDHTDSQAESEDWDASHYQLHSFTVPQYHIPDRRSVKYPDLGFPLDQSTPGPSTRPSTRYFETPQVTQGATHLQRPVASTKSNSSSGVTFNLLNTLDPVPSTSSTPAETTRRSTTSQQWK